MSQRVPTTSLGEGKNSPAVTSPSPLRPVHKDHGQGSPSVLKLVAPSSFPIWTVALACAICGHVFEYVDTNLQPKRYGRHGTKERPPRAWVVRDGIAHPPVEDFFDATERLLELKLKAGVAAERIAEELELPVPYVRAVARLTNIPIN